MIGNNNAFSRRKATDALLSSRERANKVKEQILNGQNKKKIAVIDSKAQLFQELAVKRRRSCHCEWCGGQSKLEKKLQKHPLFDKIIEKKQ